MKKQSGFTLIELMVVMAIIAILATAGLSAYTGYIKKARDTTRIADLAAINSIILADMAGDGLPPASGLQAIIYAANNNSYISDPSANDSSCNGTCNYTYYTCTSGTGYVITAKFESQSNRDALYGKDDSGYVSASDYDVGSCKSNDPTGAEVL